LPFLVDIMRISVDSIAEWQHGLSRAFGLHLMTNSSIPKIQKNLVLIFGFMAHLFDMYYDA
jgi:hypothetical protein